MKIVRKIMRRTATVCVREKEKSGLFFCSCGGRCRVRMMKQTVHRREKPSTVAEKDVPVKGICNVSSAMPKKVMRGMLIAAEAVNVSIGASAAMRQRGVRRKCFFWRMPKNATRRKYPGRKKRKKREKKKRSCVESMVYFSGIIFFNVS